MHKLLVSEQLGQEELFRLGQETAAIISDLTAECWTAERSTDESIMCYLTHPDGRRIQIQLSIETPRRMPDELYINGDYPQTEHGRSYHKQALLPGEREPQLRIGCTQPAAVLAKKIVTRFLPAYTTLYQRALNLQRQDWEFAEGQRRMRLVLAPVLEREGGAYLKTSPHLTAKVRQIGQDTVSLELMDLPLTVAWRVMAAIGVEIPVEARESRVAIITTHAAGGRSIDIFSHERPESVLAAAEVYWRRLCLETVGAAELQEIQDRVTETAHGRAFKLEGDVQIQLCPPDETVITLHPYLGAGGVDGQE